MVTGTADPSWGRNEKRDNSRPPFGKNRKQFAVVERDAPNSSKDQTITVLREEKKENIVLLMGIFGNVRREPM